MFYSHFFQVVARKGYFLPKVSELLFCFLFLRLLEAVLKFSFYFLLTLVLFKCNYNWKKIPCDTVFLIHQTSEEKCIFNPVGISSQINLGVLLMAWFLFLEGERLLVEC